MNKEKGILLIAIGPQYLKWAINLCCSLRTTSPGTPIALAVDASAKSRMHNFMSKVYDFIIDIDPDYHNDHGMPHPVKAKLYMDKISPFKQTIYIDAENLALPRKNIADLFTSKLTIQNRGSINVKDAASNPKFIHWGSTVDICKLANITSGKLYNLFSEFMTFEKSDKTTKVFEAAREAYNDLFGNVTSYSSGVPDELCFMIAINRLKIKLEDNTMPTYWEQAERKRLRMGAQLYEYYIYSMGGNTMTSEQKAIYNGNNSLTQMYCQNFGILPEKAVDKRRLFPTRQLL